MISENALKVLEYMKSIDPEMNVTSGDIAEATGLGKKQVDGIVTAAFQKKGYMQRIPGEIELEDGTHKQVKFIKLTEVGLEYDPDAPEEEEEED